LRADHFLDQLKAGGNRVLVHPQPAAEPAGIELAGFMLVVGDFFERIE
jgi:hypothetical protein